jgi:phospholipid/cholesterol/gamma-HCH transport system permease protein
MSSSKAGVHLLAPNNPRHQAKNLLGWSATLALAASVHNMPRESSENPSPSIAINGEGSRIALEGVLDIHSLKQAKRALSSFLNQRKARTLDLGGLNGLDTAGAMFLCDLRDKRVELIGVSTEHEKLLDLICGLERKALVKPRAIPGWREFIMRIGKGVDSFGRDSYDVIAFVGKSVESLVRTLTHPSLLRPAAISRQITEIGINALPIVGVMAIMISFVIGYQGLVQLRPFGGQDYTINLVAVSILREMGVLITAIMVAGRSGSAFAAELGVMKARDEVDALEVMGLGPMELLVVPRMIAIIIVLPLLTFFADIMGLVGGAILAQYELHIALQPLLDKVRLAVDPNDLLVGVIKAPIFAFIIGAIGCMHGLRVRGSAESVGRETTSAVVKAIFLVIILDALFSVFFERLGI